MRLIVKTPQLQRLNMLPKNGIFAIFRLTSRTGVTISMHDFALFVMSDGDWKKLSSYESAVNVSDETAARKAINFLRHVAGYWSNHYSKYYTSQFAVFSSQHGKNDWKLLQRL